MDSKKLQPCFRSRRKCDICAATMHRVCVFVQLTEVISGRKLLSAVTHVTARPLRMLTMLDEYTRECLAIDVSRRLTSEDVVERLSD